ncbi:MAG: DedA family protein [Clostridia bacterium]
MQELIINIMNEFGYIGVLLLIAIENIFPPIPSEVILTFSGFMTTYTNMKVLWVIIFATIGSVIGAIVLYGVGRLLNKERLEKILDSKLGHILHFKSEDIKKSEEWFVKVGKKAVFFCRFIPIVRSLISIPAGMTKMKISTFVLFTTIGSAIWNIVLISLGAIAGASWNKVVQYIDIYSQIALFVIIGITLILVFVLYKKRFKKKQEIFYLNSAD